MLNIYYCLKIDSGYAGGRVWSSLRLILRKIIGYLVNLEAVFSALRLCPLLKVEVAVRGILCVRIVAICLKIRGLSELGLVPDLVFCFFRHTILLNQVSLTSRTGCSSCRVWWQELNFTWLHQVFSRYLNLVAVLLLILWAHQQRLHRRTSWQFPQIVIFCYQLPSCLPWPNSMTAATWKC